MRLPLYQIDAFTGSVFRGNPASVMPLEEWLKDSTLQAIAAENNQAETAFFRPGEDEDVFELRWFTPTVEVPLCGHATLATAFVLMTEIDPELEEVGFDTRSGRLTVTRDGDRFVLDFPAASLRGADVPAALSDAVGAAPVEALRAVTSQARPDGNWLLVFRDESDVAGLAPDFRAVLAALAGEDVGVICTAPGRTADFVSRYFAPAHGIPEDSVTGSAHCLLVPYWAQKLGKDDLHALQISKRGGELFCRNRRDRVDIGGRAVKYMEAIAHVPG